MSILQPSQIARELVHGAYDLHVHTGPDVIKRIASDLVVARKFKERGLGGYVIKSHYAPTAGRAALANEAVPEVKVMGSITLNRSVGGMNAIAVEMAAREGARLVWMPTCDAVNEPAGRVPPQPGAKLPFWAAMQHQMLAEGVVSEAVPVVDENMQVLPETRTVLRSIAKHDLILATSHLGRDEIFAVVDAALEEGVQRIVITHPEFPSQNLSAADQKALAERGAFLEHCLAPILFGKHSWELVFDNIRATGVEHAYFAGDLGQPNNPPVEDGLAIVADALLGAGFGDDEVHRMLVTNTRRLVDV